MKSVFITRDLSPDSPFLTVLEAAGWRVEGKSLLRFTPIPFVEVPSTDWVFFYSSRAVTFYLDQAGTEWKAGTKIAVMGSGTAEALRSRGIGVDFEGQGAPGLTAKEFLKVAAHERVLFPRAKKSRRSIQKALGDHIHSIDLIVYDNVKNPAVKLPVADVLVFTSPLNVEAWFDRRMVDARQQVVAIGQTTAGALSKSGVREIFVAESPDERSLAEAVLSLE